MRRALALFGAVALAAAFSYPALAAKPPNGGNPPFELVISTRVRTTIVEGQPGVVNPTVCLWDIDDRVVWFANGTLEANASTSASDCLIADSHHHLLGFRLYSPSGALQVTVTYQPQGVTRAFTPVLVNGEYEYRGCIIGPLYDGNEPEVQIIPGSNGGWGVETTMTLTVTNPTPSKIRNSDATVTWRSSEPTSQAIYCRGLGPAFGEGGAVWQTGP